MLNENAKKWVAALRSGQYKQCKNRLAHAGRFCCLGVACDISSVPRKVWGKEATLPWKVVNWLGLNDEQGGYITQLSTTGLSHSCLSGLNDWDGKTFAEIADVIESEPEGLFRDKG